MRRLLKIVLASAVSAIVALALRRLLEDGKVEALPAPTATDGGSARTREQLYREAQSLDIEGRSKMNKKQLEEAVEAATTRGAA